MANNLRVFNLISDYNEAELVKPSVSFVVENGKVYYDDVPSPTFQGKWLATYSDSHTESAQCGSSSAITDGEINGINLVKVEIGDCVTSIGRGAFSNCKSLSSIAIPNSVTSIGGSAFYGCSSLTNINIPSGVTSIDGYAFYNCSSLSSCTLGSGVTSIGILAFAGCSSLTSIAIPNSVTSIGGSAFYGCSSLSSCTLGSGVTSIGQGAFDGCSGLTSIDIPNSVTSIGSMAFYRCSGLTSITVEATTPPTLGSYVFDSTNNCPIYVPSQSVNAYKSASGWSEYADRIQCIQPPFQGKWLATYTRGTTSSAECDASSAITRNEINRTNLVSVEIGDCVTSIGRDAFSRCTRLTSIDIPDSVTSIGQSAFVDCSGLTSITVNATTPPTLGSDAFGGSTSPIYVPSQSVEAYKTATNWSHYASRIYPIS